MDANEIVMFQKIKSEIAEAFDIGAQQNIDYYTIHNSAKYHLFEPLSKYFNELEKAVKTIENIKLNKVGCGNINIHGKIYMYSESLNNRVSGDPKNDGSFEIVELVRLDEYIETNNITKFDFIKIDTEGYEYKVLQGLGKYLTNFKFIQVEYGGTYKDMEFQGRHLMLKDIFEMLPQYHAVQITVPQILYYETYDLSLENYSYCNYLFYKPEYKHMVL